LLPLLSWRDPAVSEVFTPAEGTLIFLLEAIVVAVMSSPDSDGLILEALIGATV
jgi:hypothetical protein